MLYSGPKPFYSRKKMGKAISNLSKWRNWFLNRQVRSTGPRVLRAKSLASPFLLPGHPSAVARH